MGVKKTYLLEMKSPARLPVSKRASICALTLVSFGKEESETKRSLESIEEEDGDSEFTTSRFVSFQSFFFPNCFLLGAPLESGKVVEIFLLSDLELGIKPLGSVSLTSRECAAQPMYRLFVLFVYLLSTSGHLFFSW